ncbi:MAG: GAK system ATP-grasp enzyme [Desulfovibrionaceae bacterium]
MPKIGVVGTKGGWSSERLADAVAQATGHRLLIEMADIRLDLPSGRCWFEDTDLAQLDALIVKKIGARYSPDLLDRLEVLRYLSGRGLRIFSDPLKILRVLDRLSCTLTMQLAGIPMPPTTITESTDQALAALEHYGQAVFKPLYSTKARGMTVLTAGNGARADIEAYRSDFPVMYIQKTVDLGDEDLGLVFLGGEYLTTYARCKTGDAWNTTTASGGRYAAYDPAPEIIELARRAQGLFGLDFTCVDVALTPQGPVVFEVSAFGGFRGIEVARGIDAAQRYTQWVLGRIQA